MDKKSLRKIITDRLSSIDRIAYEQMSYAIAKRLMKTPEWQSAKSIGITVSNFPEVDTWQLIRSGWEQGKKIVVPKCIPLTKEMKFREITTFDQLENVFHHLFEPIEAITNKVHKKDIDLLIVPGLAYDKKGYRIGFGGGYYDRFLEDFHGKTLSLAFSSQIIDHIPIESYDLPVKKIVTDKEMIICQ